MTGDEKLLVLMFPMLGLALVLVLLMKIDHPRAPTKQQQSECLTETHGDCGRRVLSI